MGDEVSTEIAEAILCVFDNLELPGFYYRKALEFVIESGGLSEARIKKVEHKIEMLALRTYPSFQTLFDAIFNDGFPFEQVIKGALDSNSCAVSDNFSSVFLLAQKFMQESQTKKFNLNRVFCSPECAGWSDAWGFFESSELICLLLKNGFLNKDEVMFMVDGLQPTFERQAFLFVNHNNRSLAREARVRIEKSIFDVMLLYAECGPKITVL